MKTDRSRFGTCPPRCEQHREFLRQGHKYVEYEYRADTGELFSTVAQDLATARQQRDAWLRELT